MTALVRELSSTPTTGLLTTAMTWPVAAVSAPRPGCGFVESMLELSLDVQQTLTQSVVQAVPGPR